MALVFPQLNWLAVLVAAVATFLVGGLWYTVLFGKRWQRLHGYTAEKMAQMHANRPPPVFFSILFACYLVIAATVAILLSMVGAQTPAAGALVGLLLWVVAAGIGTTAWASSDKPAGAFVIDLGYQLVFLPLMGTILGAWR